METVGCVLAAIDVRFSGYVNTAKTHRYHSRFVHDIVGALRRSVSDHSSSNSLWPQRTLPLMFDRGFDEADFVGGEVVELVDVLIDLLF